MDSPLGLPILLDCQFPLTEPPRTKKRAVHEELAIENCHPGEEDAVVSCRIYTFPTVVFTHALCRCSSKIVQVRQFSSQE